VLLRDGAATVISWVALPTSAVTGRAAVAGRAVVGAGSASAGEADVVDRDVVRATGAGGATVVVLITVVGGGVRVVLAAFRDLVLVTVVATVADTVSGAGATELDEGVIAEPVGLGDGVVAARLAVVNEGVGPAPESAEHATDSSTANPSAATAAARMPVEVLPVRSVFRPRRVTMPR